jgi:hypothetical protein
MRVTTSRLSAALLAWGLLALPAQAQDRVFSGPQPGEKITPFRVLDVTGPNAGKELDYVSQFGGTPTVLVFVHALERSIVPLMTVIDEYGSGQKDRLKTLFVFLTADRVASEQRLPLVNRSLRMQSPLAISLDGAEGPGNYGLNKNCLLTIIVAKEDQVAAKFALVQPGIADAPKVLEAIARVIGDASPPTAEALRARRQANAGRMRPAAGERAPTDLSRFDLNTPEGLREAVRALFAEVQALREQLAALRGRVGSVSPTAPSPSAPAQR